MKAGHTFTGRALLAALLTLFCAPLPAALLQVVVPTADGHVRSASEKKNFATDPILELRMSTSGGAAEGFLRFPLPASAAQADRAVLRLHAQLTEPGSLKLLIRSVAPTPWTETELTWRNRPEHQETVGAINIVGLSGAWYEVDVSAFVKSELKAGRRETCFALVPGDDSKTRITVQSRESSQKKPELVLSRQLLRAKVSFVPKDTTPPEGYLADHGEVFGERSTGRTFGWNTDNTEFVRDRSDSRYRKDRNPPSKTPDRRYDFTAYMDNEKMPEPVRWEMAVPNGPYRVRVVAGDSFKFDSIFGLTVEGVTVIDGIPDTNKRWLEGTVDVAVQDGRLTIGNTTDSSNNKLCFVEISELESLVTQTP